MNAQALIDSERTMVASDKGLLAMDESTRRAYRERIVTTPGLGECISGAILYDETIRRQKDDTPFVKAITVRESFPPSKLTPMQRARQVIPERK